MGLVSCPPSPTKNGQEEIEYTSFAETDMKSLLSENQGQDPHENLLV